MCYGGQLPCTANLHNDIFDNRCRFLSGKFERNRTTGRFPNYAEFLKNVPLVYRYDNSVKPKVEFSLFLLPEGMERTHCFKRMAERALCIYLHSKSAA